MTAPSYRHRYTYEEYLAYEDSGNTKHELLDGVILGIAGGSPEHSAIATERSDCPRCRAR